MSDHQQDTDKTKEEVLKEESNANDNLLETDVEGIEDAKKWRTPGFQRMRIDWRGEDRAVWERARGLVDARLMREFEDAYRLMYEIHDSVREPEVDEHGEIQKDVHGFPIWKKNEYGDFIENWDDLPRHRKEDFMFTLTTRIFFWQQTAADAWGEAMFAKAAWEESFSIGFDEAKVGTVDHRTARGKLHAREERYFAVFLSYYSRKAEGLVRSLELLSQRLKDAMTL